MTTTATLLALDPGTRAVGVAVFRGSFYDDASVVSLRRSWPTQTRLQVLERMLTRIVVNVKPTCAAVLAAPPHRGSDAATAARILRVSQRLLARRGCPPVLVSWEAVTQRVVEAKSASRRAVAWAVCQRYPHLASRLPVPGNREGRYQLRLFIAVATALTHLDMTRSDYESAHDAV